VFIHGLDNKPAPDYLYALWKRKLAHQDGPDLDAASVASAMAYWADVLYPSPDTNLAAYESAAGEVDGLGPAEALRLDGLAPADAGRIRRLAGALGVDPESPPPEPPPGEVEAVRQERVPVPAWLRVRIMSKFVRDAHHYFFNVEFRPRAGERYFVRDELRRRFLDRLKAAAADTPLVVVSHSMGTVIAYDCLMHEPSCPAVDTLFTIGSPLGLDEVQDFFPAWTRDDGFPEKIRGQWINVFDPLDVVAGADPHLANDYRQAGRPAVEDLREDNWGKWRHSISKYLQGEKLREKLAAALQVDWP
jgi:hypothetical protein